MRVGRLLVKRALLGLATVWATVSGVFLLFVGTEDWYLSAKLANANRDPDATRAEIEQQRQAYLAERGLDGDLWEVYLEWMERTFTFQWGNSFEYGRSALDMVLAGAARTAAYVVPAVLLAVLVGLAIGVLTGMNSRSRGETGLRGLVYAGMGVPNFWLGALLLTLASGAAFIYTPIYAFGPGAGMPEIAVAEWSFLYSYVVPVLLLATTLVAAVVSYARAYSMQYHADDLTKLVRAKGGGRLDVARHVVRNAAVPLVSLLFTETLALIALSVFVIEAVFAIDGIGSLYYNSIWTQDLPILLGGAMTFVALSVLSNVCQDLLHAVLDPRVDTTSL